MKTPRSRIARVIADKTLKSGSSKRLSREVAAYLLTERRVNELDSVLRDVQTDWTAAGQVEVIATTAHPLSAAGRTGIVKQIRQLYPQAKRIIVTEHHDPGVVAGVRLNLADEQLDLSARNKLNTLKQLAIAGRD